MARKIVFTNSLGSTFTADNDGTPFMITSISGLGIPEVNLQSQKSPYQDGTTYIDALLQDRQIVVEVSVNLPNDFAGISTARREIVNRLNPKNGLGTLVYYTEDGQSYKITAVVTACLFPNKQYTEPFLRAQVTFNANDPYWRKVTDETVSLPAPAVGDEVTINAASSNDPSVIQKVDGNLFVAYRRNSDGYLVSREYTSSWGAEVVINAASSLNPSVVQKVNGDLFVAYRRNSDGYLVSREYTSSWGAEVVINAASSSGPSVVQKVNGNLFVAYRRNSDGYLVSREYTSSWGAEVVINAADSNDPSVVQKVNGDLFVAYRRNSDGYLVSREYTSSWGAEVVINAADSLSPSVIQKVNGNLFVAYTIPSYSLVSREYTTSWGAQITLATGLNNSTLSAIQKSDQNFFYVYIGVSNYVYSRERVITPAVVTVTGDVPTPILVTFNGPSTNPQIVKEETGEYIRLNTTLATGDTFVVNTAFGQKTVVLTQGGIVKNGTAFLDIGSTFFSLDVGVNTVYLDDGTSTATASMVYTERYTGI